MFDLLFQGIAQVVGSRFLYTAFVAIVGLIVANYVLKLIFKLLDSSKVIDSTLLRFIKPCINVIMYFFVAMIVANSLGINTSSVVALASVLSAAIALAAQNVLSNLFGGITLLATRPFNVGDFVEVAGVSGVVSQIGIFYTVLNTVDNKRITVPNGAASAATVTNFSVNGKRRVDLVVSSSYDCSIDDVKKAIFEAIEMTDNICDDDKFVRLSEYGDSAISYTVRVWCLNGDYWSVYFDLLENVKRAFDKNNIEMTYNHMIIHNAKD